MEKVGEVFVQSTAELSTDDRLGEVAHFYDETLLPVILFDKNFLITYISKAAYCIFGSELHVDLSFFDFVKKYLPLQTFQVFSSFIQNSHSSYSWMGTLTIPSMTSGSRYIHIAIQPAAHSIKPPEIYSAIFQDATDEYMSFLQMTFTSILEAARLKDNETGKHNERLNYYARVFAEFLDERDEYPQIDTNFIEDISFLAAMHDVGKIGTPDAILKKNGPLTEWEWSVMKEHTINGPFILASYPNPMAKEIALSHHEHWDGSGYPYNLSGEMIPLSARIVAICDVYDALRMKRNYKNGLPHAKTVEMIIAESGTHFDPALIKEFKIIHLKFDEIWREHGEETDVTEI